MRAPRSDKRLAVAAGIVFLLLFLGQGLRFIRANSPTYDEAMHLAAGYSYLARQDFRLELQNPPFMKMLAALPIYLWYSLPFEPAPELWLRAEDWQIGQDFLYGTSLPADWLLTLGRFPNLFLGTVLVLLIGWWADRLWGHGAAVLGLAVAALETNLLAHSCLITTDIGAALFTFSALYFFWEYSRSPSGWLLVAGCYGAVHGLGAGLEVLDYSLGWYPRDNHGRSSLARRQSPTPVGKALSVAKCRAKSVRGSCRCAVPSPSRFSCSFPPTSSRASPPGGLVCTGT